LTDPSVPLSVILTVPAYYITWDYSEE
jgi:hypothetical protein